MHKEIKTIINLWISAAIKQKLRNLSKKSDLSVSEYVGNVLKEHIEKEEGKDQSRKEGEVL